MPWWDTCNKCKGSGFIKIDECLVCRYEVCLNVIIRGKIYISDNPEPVSLYPVRDLDKNLTESIFT